MDAAACRLATEETRHASHQVQPRRAQPASETERDVPPLPLRLLGRSLGKVIVRAPVRWPVVRRPTRRFSERMANHWTSRSRLSAPSTWRRCWPGGERLDREPGAILELGTGIGALALGVASPQRRSSRFDISAAMVGAAQAKTPPELGELVRFPVADAASLPCEALAFDLVAQLTCQSTPMSWRAFWRRAGT